MLCWSCEKNAGGSAFCAACGAIQPPDGGRDRFAILGTDRRFEQDVDALERRYKDLARQIHPDRFAKADPRARRAALAQSVAVNEAWKALRDPVRRAEYLLSLHGIDVGAEDGTRRTRADGSHERVAVPADLLGEVMELREGLMEARLAADEARVAALTEVVRGRRESALATVASGFAASPPALEDVTAALVALRYWNRFLEEVDAHADAAGQGA